MAAKLDQENFKDCRGVMSDQRAGEIRRRVIDDLMSRRDAEKRWLEAIRIGKLNKHYAPLILSELMSKRRPPSAENKLRAIIHLRASILISQEPTSVTRPIESGDEDLSSIFDDLHRISS